MRIAVVRTYAPVPGEPVQLDHEAVVLMDHVSHRRPTVDGVPHLHVTCRKTVQSLEAGPFPLQDRVDPVFPVRDERLDQATVANPDPSG